MDATATPGAFSWNELMTTDPLAARAFYGELLGWTFREQPMPEGLYHVGELGGASVCGIMAISPATGPMPPNWGSYVTVADVDASARRAVELGGTVCAGPFDIPGVGRMAVVQDPQGAVIHLITYSA